MNIKDLMPFGKKNVAVKREEDARYYMVRRDIASLFDNFFFGIDSDFFGGRAGQFMPRADIRENEKEIRISVELPGMDEKDVEVSLSRNALTIKGEKKEEREDKGKDYQRLERTYGYFSRTIPLSGEVESDNIEAYFKKGILHIALPKSAKALAGTNKIVIKAEQVMSSRTDRMLYGSPVRFCRTTGTTVNSIAVLNK